jgi:urease accessory protein
MRPNRPYVFTNLKTGIGLDVIIDFVIKQGMLDAA